MFEYKMTVPYAPLTGDMRRTDVYQVEESSKLFQVLDFISTKKEVVHLFEDDVLFVQILQVIGDVPEPHFIEIRNIGNRRFGVGLVAYNDIEEPSIDRDRVVLPF